MIERGTLERGETGHTSHSLPASQPVIEGQIVSHYLGILPFILDDFRFLLMMKEHV